MDVFRRNREVGMLLSLHIKRHGAIHFYPLWLAKLSGQYWNFSEPILLYCDLFNSSCKAQREKAEQGVGSLKIATRQRELERKGLCWATPPSCRTFPSQCCWVTACWCFSLRFKAEDAVTYYLLGCLPAILQTFYTFLTNGCISLPRPRRQSTQRRGSARARQGTVTDTST